ncbi:hypothetical protein HETIRDRAFT_108245 [Heterobasidion irregulare TC 32-1]|uniref:Uncharacterized protein n=1 Tax=Heterobasidion irregulare (strain TC 32-1) TaxID=747525 RepID=W4JPX0_HETIT|nr:uncharacterized protein HETIRDRAFT_108245 [Heterobasidion irregulare TC 32-1]ETW75130.1 hypothetical protein HETIRDRAFT_108245 [Heterobasidion irregulare TC 32-1]
MRSLGLKGNRRPSRRPPVVLADSTKSAKTRSCRVEDALSPAAPDPSNLASLWAGLHYVPPPPPPPPPPMQHPILFGLTIAAYRYYVLAAIAIEFT